MAQKRSASAYRSKSRGRWARLSEAVQSRLWPLPLGVVILSVALGIALPRVDLLMDAALPTGVDSVIFNGGADTARSVLSSIAGSLITATSLTFSLTVVALQLASSQASPRVLRLFASDRQVHTTLAIFLGTFAYSITVLRSVRSATTDIPEFVPRVAVTTGFVMTLASVITLVFFLAHLATQLRVETILKEIHAETDHTIDLVGAAHEVAPAYALRIRTPQEKRTVTSTSSGFITSQDHAALVECATEQAVVIEELRRVGDNVVTGTPLAYWWSAEAHADDGADAEADAEAVEAAVEAGVRGAHAIGYERTAAQDIDYGVQQIVDIGVRALSPGINDPTTAVHALGHLGALAARSILSPRLPAGLAGRDGELRVVTMPMAPADVIHGALSQVRHYGAGDPAVVTRFLQAVEDLAYACDGAETRAALAAELAALERQLSNDEIDPLAVAEMLRATTELSRSLAQPA